LQLKQDLSREEKNDQSVKHKDTEEYLQLYIFKDYMSGTVHTRGESLQDGLRYMQTCGTILASAYVLHCLSVV